MQLLRINICTKPIPTEIILHILSYVPKLLNNNNIHAAVTEYCSDKKSETIKKYGKIQDWDTKYVTNMSNLFSNCYEFNEDISNWNVSNVVNMNYMFQNAKSFNQPLNDWNVSNNVYQHCMFIDARSFNMHENAPWYMYIKADFRRNLLIRIGMPHLY